jgi:hypothetical protein
MNPQQQTPAQALRLHWIPVNPSWIVSAGLIILAVLPHKIPEGIRLMLTHTTTRLLFGAVAIYTWILSPVLGIAMLILLVGVATSPRTIDVEQFTIRNLNHDRVKEKRSHWFIEDTLAEEPHGIQDRTGETNLNYDEVSDKKTNWHVEKMLDEHPVAIQDKPVSELTINDSWR